MALPCGAESRLVLVSQYRAAVFCTGSTLAHSVLTRGMVRLLGESEAPPEASPLRRLRKRSRDPRFRTTPNDFDPPPLPNYQPRKQSNTEPENPKAPPLFSDSKAHNSDPWTLVDYFSLVFVFFWCGWWWA
eukprot:180088-Rhodomonas_salina.3